MDFQVVQLAFHFSVLLLQVHCALVKVLILQIELFLLCLFLSQVTISFDDIVLSKLTEHLKFVHKFGLAGH